MKLKVYKQETLVFDLDSEVDSFDKVEELQKKLGDEDVELVTIQFVDNMSLSKVNDFMSDVDPSKIVMQTIKLK